MFKNFSFFFLTLIFTLPKLGVANPWSLMTQPKQISPTAQSIGSYNNGCLSGAVAMPSNGIGYQMMRLSRNRVFGHPELKLFIEQLGQATANQGLGTLLIGDLGQVRGGPTISGHRSHQTGLDVDIWFLLTQQANTRLLSANERENWSATSVLLNSSDQINTAQWSINHEKILETAARMPSVDRIFVNPSVKRELCKTKGNHDWLRKIRPWWKHDDHFHVRLHCPAGNLNCVSQEPLPAGDGCDAGLAWWFSTEAKNPTSPKTKPEPALHLPSLCNALLN
ncbi:MAG: penicillin-insensitive murein endopeptidase [Methylovulum sp.]|jgi:penicillin-insensitive murein endopeptidase|nr:penicillin-insensitive murein endopeptidase [Methylovulum sp.]MCF7999356.1 penicillin-insensitive murein endopeptidase [Methylovulum sp.]